MDTEKLMDRQKTKKQGALDMEPAESEKQVQYDLEGIDAICDYMQRGSSELIQWVKFGST
jgi:hypothetical protein